MICVLLFEIILRSFTAAALYLKYIKSFIQYYHILYVKYQEYINIFMI